MVLSELYINQNKSPGIVFKQTASNNQSIKFTLNQSVKRYGNYLMIYVIHDGRYSHCPRRAERAVQTEL